MGNSRLETFNVIQKNEGKTYFLTFLYFIVKKLRETVQLPSRGLTKHYSHDGITPISFQRSFVQFLVCSQSNLRYFHGSLPFPKGKCYRSIQQAMAFPHCHSVSYNPCR